MKKCFYLTILLFVIGCAGPSRIIMAPNYQKHSIRDASLAFIILEDYPYIEYKGSIEGALGAGDPQRRILQFFKTQLMRDLMKQVNLKTTFERSPESHFLVSNENVSAPEGNVVVELPAKDTYFEFSGIEADYVLLISKMRLGSQTDEYSASRTDEGINTSPSRQLIYNTNFVLWDNRARQYISYGRIRSLVPIAGEEATREEWEKVSQQYVYEIFKPTGFLKAN